MGELLWGMWGHYMAVTAGLIAIDGGLWSFIFNYPSLDMFKTLPLYAPISIPGAASILLGVLTEIIELKFKAPVALRAIYYLICAAVAGFQFSTVIGMQCYLVTFFVLMIAAFKGESGDFEADIKGRQKASRSNA
ncbi:hypothetical protein BC828DRAFT_401098 [Blastocladiella britannica]|nr:hypothetical protein BC828DRAFT_401098 [Blastocladiella britannica]